MSNLPLLLSLAEDFDRFPSSSPFHINPSVYYNRCPKWLLMPSMPRESELCRHLRLEDPDRYAVQRPAGGPAVGKNGFQLSLDVAQFKPSELNVKVVDNSVLIEGKHEEREDDHGFISRHFVRRYTLPQGYDAEKVASTLSSDGVLTVSVPKPPEVENCAKERTIQIQQVGPAHLSVKENQPEESDKVENKDNAQSTL